MSSSVLAFGSESTRTPSAGRVVDASGRAPRNFALVYAGPPKRTLGDADAPLSSLGPGPVALMVADLDA